MRAAHQSAVRAAALGELAPIEIAREHQLPCFIARHLALVNAYDEASTTGADDRVTIGYR